MSTCEPRIREVEAEGSGIEAEQAVKPCVPSSVYPSCILPALPWAPQVLPTGSPGSEGSVFLPLHSPTPLGMPCLHYWGPRGSRGLLDVANACFILLFALLPGLASPRCLSDFPTLQGSQSGDFLRPCWLLSSHLAFLHLVRRHHILHLFLGISQICPLVCGLLKNTQV